MTDTSSTVDPTVRELPIAPGGELELRLGANRLRVRTTDGDRVVIRGRTDHDLERDVEITSGTGWVRVSDGPVGSFRIGPLTLRNGGHAPDLDVEVPRNVRISARTLSGDIEAVGIAGPSRWQSASGDVRVAADGGQVSVDTVSGDATIVARAPIAVAARTVSGSVRIRAPRLQTLDAATTSGNISVEASLDAGGHHSMASVSGDVRLATGSEVTVELQSVAGDIRASVPHRSEGARGRRTIVVGAGRVRIAVRTMSGDVEILPGVPDEAVGDAGSAAPGGDAQAGTGPGPEPTWAAGAAWGDAPTDRATWGGSFAGDSGWGEPAAPAAPGTPLAPAPPATPAAPEAPSATDEPAAADAAATTPAAVVQPAAGPAEAAPSLDDTAPVPAATRAELEAARLDVLRSLERGELDVEAAAARLAAIEDAAQASEG